jgi:hypothetical protein
MPLLAFGHRAKKANTDLIRFLLVRVLMALVLSITFASWSMSSAVGGSPDEDYVISSIWCGTEGNPPFCRKDPDRPNAMILPIMVAEPGLCLRQLGADYSAKCQESIYNLEISTESVNNDLYPKQYLDVQRNLVSNNIQESVLKMRFLNSLIAAILVVLAISLYENTDLDILFFWLIAITPVSSYLITSVNTSSWALIGTTCFVIASISILNTTKRFKSNFLAISVAMLSLWIANSSRNETKYSILTLLLFICFSTYPSNKTKTPRVFSKGNLTALISIYFVTKLVFKRDVVHNFFTIQRSIPDYATEVSGGNLILQNIFDSPRFFTGFFGSWGLGSFDLKLTSTVWLFALQSFIMTAIFAFLKSNKYHKLIFCSLFVIMIGAIIGVHQNKFFVIGEQIQPRYFLPFFLGTVVIIASNKSEPFPKSLMIISAVLTIVSNSIALRDTIRRYTTGQDILISKSLNSPLEWWWQLGPQPETVWLSGSLSFAALFAIIAFEQRSQKFTYS